MSDLYAPAQPVLNAVAASLQQITPGSPPAPLRVDVWAPDASQPVATPMAVIEPGDGLSWQRLTVTAEPVLVDCDVIVTVLAGTVPQADAVRGACVRRLVGRGGPAGDWLSPLTVAGFVVVDRALDEPLARAAIEGNLPQARCVVRLSLQSAS